MKNFYLFFELRMHKVQMFLTILCLLIVCSGNMWGAQSYHTVVPNICGTSYEMYGLQKEIYKSTTTVQDAFSSWVTYDINGQSGTSVSEPSGWLDGDSGKPGYGLIKVRSGKPATFYVTNCTGVAILAKAANASKYPKLSIKDASTSSEVGSEATTTTTSWTALAYGTTLDPTHNYIVKVYASTDDNIEVSQIRFTAPATCSAALSGTTSNASATTGESAGTISCGVSNGAAASATSYQWYRTTSNKAAASSISGATSSTYSPAEASAGTYYYYCEVTTTQRSLVGVTGSCKVETDLSGAFVFASAASGWSLKGFGDWSTGTPMTGSGTVTCTKSLSANTKYEFKVVDTSSDTWYGSSDHKIGGTKTTSTLPSGTGTNIYLLTTEAGTYTFSFNTSTKVLTVTYPNSYKVYYKNTGSWGSVKAYKYTYINPNTGENAAWASAPTVATTEEICGDTYYYTMTDGYKTIIFYNGSNSSNKTGDMSAAAANAGKYVQGTESSWTAFPTYTVTYNKNGNGAGGDGSVTGSVPTDASSPYACGSTVTVLGKGNLALSGYTFNGWNTAPGGGGTSYAADATFSISENTTLYAQWAPILYTVTYDVNGSGSVTPTSITQASLGASVTLATPTWSGYTIEGWYNNKSKLGNVTASYTPTANITAYAHWTDNISGKVFSYIDNSYGDKFKDFKDGNWVTGGGSSKDKTYTNGTTGVQFDVDDGAWDNKSNAISALAKFVNGTTKMKVVVPTGKIATVKISYGAYNTSNRLTVGGNNQTALSTALTDGMTNAQVYSALKEITLSNQQGTLNLGSSSGNIYIGRVSAVITGYVVTYDKGANGTGTIAAGTKTHGSNFTLSSSTFSRDDYTQDGWSTSDGGDKVYDLGGTYSTDAAITLYPHWVTCIEPTTVTVGPTNANGYRYTPGETISLTCTATGGFGDYSYQWQKYNGSAWADIDGATSAVYSKSNCTTSDGGSYRCKVSTGAGCEKISDGGEGYKIRVWTFTGNYSGSGFVANNITWTGANTGTVTLTLNASSTYEFKVTDNDGKHFGCNSGISADASNWTFRTNEGNCALTTASVAGEYTFTIDITNVADNNISVSVSYPKKRIYMVCGGTWCDADPAFFVHSWKNSTTNDAKMIAHPCEDGVFYADLPYFVTDMTILRLKTGTESVVWEANANFLNRSSNITIGSNDKFTFSSWDTEPEPDMGLFSGSVYSPTTYTISFAGNGGSGSMSSIGSIACGANQALTANSFEKTGYNFSHWTANVDVKVGGETITAGSAIANSATLQNITSNITLTAQWSPKTYTITLDRNGGSGDNQVITATYGSSSLSAAVTTPTRGGYNFRGWYNVSGGSGLQVIGTGGTLNASVGAFTNSSSEWIYTSNATLFARWTQCTAYSFTYGTNGQNDWASACFTQVGSTNEWNITDFTIPDKPNFYVGWTEDFSVADLGSNHSWSVERAWTDVPSQSDSKWQGQMVLLPAATSSAVGQATGAIGKLVIWDNSAHGNLYVGFEPNGYGVTTAAGTYAFTIGDGYFCYTDPITISSAEASGNFQVKLATSSSYVACAHGTAENASAVNGRKITGDADIANGKKGVFQMWQNSATNNFGLRFVTVYDVSFDMQGHGSSISDYTNVRYNDKIVAPSAPTASGYTFGGWYKEEGCTNAWDFANDVVTEATTLYAKWEEDCFYADDLKKKKGGSDIANNATITASLLASGTITGGTLTNTSGGTLGHSETYGLVYAASGNKEVTLALTGGGALVEGSKITLAGYSNNTTNAVGFKVGNQAMSEGDFTPASAEYTLFTRTYTLGGSSPLVDKTSFTITASTSEKVYLTSIRITGCGDCTKPGTPSRPTIESGTLTHNSATFAWDVLGATPNSNGYEVSIVKVSDGSTILDWTSDGIYAEGMASLYDASGLTPNTSYYFNVRAKGEDGYCAYGDTSRLTFGTEQTYTITYDLHDGDAGATVSGKTTYARADDDYDLPTPTWTGHSFIGWYETYSAGTYSNPVSILASGSTGNKTFHAKWADAVTVNWTATEEAVSGKFYKGGSGHTILAEIDDESWDASGDYTKLELHASEGVILGTQTTSINGSGKAQVTASFDIGCDVEDDAITFTLTAPAAGSYGAIEDEKEVTLDACPGGKSVYFTSSNKNDAGSNFANMSSGDSQLVGNGIAKLIGTGDAKLGTADKKSGYRSDGRMVMVFKFTKATDLDIYFCAGSSGPGFTLYSFSSANELADITTSDYSTKSEVKSGSAAKATFGTCTTAAGSASFNTTTGFASVASSGGGIKVSYSSLSAGYYVAINSSGSESYFYGFDIDGGSSVVGIATSLTWSGSLADKATVNKHDYDDDFTYTATKSNNSLGEISYSSSNESVATVNASGKVHIVGDGTTTITATVASCGCYNGSSISYTLNVANSCADAPGTIVNDDGSAIEGNAISRGICATTTLRLTGYSDGATVQWYKDGASILGATSATYTVPAGTSYSGAYSAKTTNACTLSSTNSISITTSGTVNPTIFADEFSVKDDRWFGYRLMQLNQGETVVVKTAPTGWRYETDYKIIKDANNIVSIEGNVNVDAAANKTLTLTISNSCGASVDKDITIHELAKTAKPTVAWIATGETKGDKTSVYANQSTNTALYQYLETDYTLTKRNCYWTTDEKELVKEYSQYDLIILTDYPNSQKGPNGDGRSKSYTNALGLLIDHKPILTFEAFVAGCPNWGISSNPKDTKSTQNTLTLLCNADDIFGTSSKFYAGADITTGTVESGQSLQGFAINESPDFVYIAKITDGGTEYITCCERQIESAARMMVFGLNSNVMGNITADGKQMVKGFLDYLLIMDPAQIPDCSVIFTGATDTDWFKASNWEGNSLPNKYASVRIDAPCVVGNHSTHGTARAGYVKIHTGSDGVHTYTGHLTIAADGAMLVQKTVTRVEGKEYTIRKATSPSNLTIGSNSGGNGALVFANKDGKSQATVQMYSKATYPKGETATWQYIAVPFSDNNNAHHNYYDSWLYRWNEACTGWEVVKNRGNVYPWIGYCITQRGTTTYTMDGTLVPTTEKKFVVPAGKEMVIGNSWTAPIQVKQFTDADFGSMQKKVYLFNTGLDASATGTTQTEGITGDDRYAAGTYIVIPIHSATYSGDSLISSLQAFSVNNTAGGSAATLTLNYDRHVRTTRLKDTINAGPMHAPARFAEEIGEPAVLKIWASGSRYNDRLVLLERPDFSTGYDDGWDGEKWSAEDCETSPRLYSVMESGEEAVTATPELEGTILGFRAGEDELYTFRFEYNEDEEPIYLFDSEYLTYTRVLTGSTYTFLTTDKEAHHRFILTRQAPQVTTDIEPVGGENVRAMKLIIEDKVFILRNGVLYDITGKVVK